MHAKRDVLIRDVEWEKHCNGHYDTYNQTKSKQRLCLGVTKNMMVHVSGTPKMKSMYFYQQSSYVPLSRPNQFHPPATQSCHNLATHRSSQLRDVLSYFWSYTYMSSHIEEKITPTNRFNHASLVKTKILSGCNNTCKDIKLYIKVYIFKRILHSLQVARQMKSSTFIYWKRKNTYTRKVNMETIWRGMFRQGEFTSNAHYSPARLWVSVIKEQCDSYKVTTSLWMSAGRTSWRRYRDTRLHTDSRDTEAVARRGDRLTWLKPRSTTVPAHRTWDWGPAVLMSCRFCSRILGGKKHLKSLHHTLPQSRRNRCDTLFLISRTSFGLVFIGMNWLATAAWRTPSSFDHCK